MAMQRSPRIHFIRVVRRGDVGGVSASMLVLVGNFEGLGL
jgi:hypothetical protein